MESRASVSPSMALFAPFLSLSSSASRHASGPVGLPSSPATAWLPEFHAFLLLEDGGRPRLFSPLPGGLPGSRLTFSAGLSGPSGFACVPAGSNKGNGRLEAALCAVRTRGGRPLGFFSCIDGESKKRTRYNVGEIVTDFKEIQSKQQYIFTNWKKYQSRNACFKKV